ncbi:methyltransferase family protein [Ectobacillus sp. sgz5001026]|uniref:methyltransferase family protein n=1 Tax=Ectobacillus sp. sgz5001026 TaxID=3242473 RepID=UPI0036D28AF8
MGTNSVSKLKMYIVPMLLMIVMWMILFLPAGTTKFWEAWIFWFGFSLLTLFITIYFSKKNPELLARRTKVREEATTKKAPAFFKLYYIGFLIPGIDFRFHWSHEPIWLVMVSNLIVFAAYIFIFVVFKENSYASTVIQVENEQHVITTGPYSIVRHPMYLGMVIMSFFLPLALGSYFAIIPMLFIIPTLLFRIKNEEAVLLRELSGYKEYCLQTQYRLIPFIW